MLIRKYLENRQLHQKSWVHLALVKGFLPFDFAFPHKTEIIIEHGERLPGNQPAIIAMNHTNIYNYAPFLFHLFRLYQADSNRPFPAYAFWSKARFFHQPIAGAFLAAANVIPLPSRGYLLAKDFKDTLKRVPDDAEYRLLRDLVDEEIRLEQFLAQADVDLRGFVTEAHGAFNPQAQTYVDFIEAQYVELMGLVTEISSNALLKQKMKLLIFPEGAVSLRLRAGQTGLAQLALKTGVPVIPVGCNGLDKLYPTKRPFSQGGEAVYRMGQPLTLADDLAPFAIDQPFTPFTAAARAYEANFRGATELIMRRLNELLDPPYQFSADAPPPDLQGARRFV